MKYSNPLISTLLIGAGLINLVAPVLAVGTAADTDISNTATATYQDPSGATSNTTSNTVSVKVAEVAGITITAGAVSNTTTPGASPVAGDALTFEFEVTNTGNDTTDIHIPNQANTNGSPATVTLVEYFNKATNAWESVAPGGKTISTNSTDGGSIKPGDVVKVRVKATVNAGTTSGAINITLGNTGQTNLQNDPFTAGGGDVYTVDKTDGSIGEVAGMPTNGVREAAATGTTVVNPTKQAFVKVTKVAGAVDQSGTVNDLTDDKVTYTLGLDVAGTAPTGTNLIAEDLAGTNINVDGVVVPRILVSDAIPAPATLAAAPVAPAGWTVVYTDAAIGTTAATDASVMWKTTAPAALSSVTRVGYILTGTIAKGTSVPGFALTVKLNLGAGGGSVLNIAQAFGTTAVNGAPDPTKPAVDESGDNQFNNLNPDGTPGPNPTNGVATGADGTDPTNTNTGTGPGGEANVVTVAPTSAGVPLFNGPLGQAKATGPSGLTNDDFTNKSITIDSTQAKWTNGVPDAVDPQSTGFTNTLAQGPGATRPQYVSLLPTPPANKADLPTGTLVSIVGPTGKVTYTYDAVTGAFTPVVAGQTPVTVTVPTTGTVDYGVEIDLPAGTPQMKAFPVSITSFANGAPAVVDAATGAVTAPAIAGDNVIDPTDAQNITIDRLYTGFVKLAKEAQVYKMSGTMKTIVSPFSAAAPKAAPGEFIEYRINYSNISEAVAAGSNSVGLSATNLKIVEDGMLAPNNWATVTDNVASSAQDNQGAIMFDGGASTTTDLGVKVYVDTVPTVAPGTVGSFTFTRKVK